MKENVKKEITEYVITNILKYYSWKKGLNTKDLKVLIMEIFGYKGKVISIYTFDENGKKHNYHYKKYQKYYTNDWVVEAVKEIEKLGPKCKNFISMRFPKSIINV